VTSRFSKKALSAALAALAATSALVLSACVGGDPAKPAQSNGTGSGLMTDGTLVVGMNLQYKPEMFLDDKGNPSGYDVDLLNALAANMGIKLSIKNLDFNGLIPGLQSAQFDMVSAGLGATDKRKEVISFSRGYVPYSTILGIRAGGGRGSTITDYNQKGVVITTLQGSTSEQLAPTTFPNATVTSFPDQNAALLEVASGRADAIIVEDYILAEFNRANRDALAVAKLDKPLSLYYGAWGVQKGNQALIDKLDAFICSVQKDGTLEKLYTTWMAPTMPTMPAC